MKTQTILAFAILALSLVAKATPPAPTHTPATFNKIYVPSGFDSNDNVQLVGEGVFPNTCYRPANVTVEVDHAGKKIHLGPAAYEYPGTCIGDQMPFNRTVEIGVLEAGTWEVYQETSSGRLGTIDVRAAAVQTADEFTYAPVSQAFFKQDVSSIQVLLTGNFVNTCMKIKELKLSVQEDVIVLQPIVEMENRRDCAAGQIPFKTWIAIDYLRPKRYLLHVRSMNGNSINTLVDAL